MELTIVALLFLVSAGANIFFVIEKFKKKAQAPYSKDALDLLSELNQGRALVRIELVDSNSVFKMSPRDM